MSLGFLGAIVASTFAPEFTWAWLITFVFIECSALAGILMFAFVCAAFKPWSVLPFTLGLLLIYARK